MTPEFLLYGGYALALLAGFLIRHFGGGKVPAPGPDGQLPIPDLLPGNPFLNKLLKMILGKLLSGEPLLAGENLIAKQFRDQLTANFPFLAKIIDALDGPAAKPAA